MENIFNNKQWSNQEYGHQHYISFVDAKTDKEIASVLMQRIVMPRKGEAVLINKKYHTIENIIHDYDRGCTIIMLNR